MLDNFTSDYKDRLISLDLLSLMMFYELLDIMFFIKSFKSPNDCFNISSYLKLHLATFILTISLDYGIF